MFLKNNPLKILSGVGKIPLCQYLDDKIHMRNQFIRKLVAIRCSKQRNFQNYQRNYLLYDYWNFDYLICIFLNFTIKFYIKICLIVIIVVFICLIRQCYALALLSVLIFSKFSSNRIKEKSNKSSKFKKLLQLDH